MPLLFLRFTVINFEGNFHIHTFSRSSTASPSGLFLQLLFFFSMPVDRNIGLASEPVNGGEVMAMRLMTK